MTNEDKILELLTVIQQDVANLKTDVADLKTDVVGIKADVANLKTDVTGLKAGQERLELKVTDIEVKLDKLAETQTSDIHTLVKLTHDKVTRLDGKLGILNNRLFEQEADIQVLKLVK